MIPIWKDYFVDLAEYAEDASFVDYDITTSGDEVLYSGRAYKAPDGSIKVYINDILADYLGHQNLLEVLYPIGPTPVITNDFQAIVKFRVKVGDTQVDEVTAFNCWDYQTETLTRNEVLSGTISKEYVEGQPFVYTKCVNSFVIGYPVAISHYISVPAGYTQVDCCNPAVLYFYNARCGWDFLLCKGGARLTQSYERSIIKHHHDNAYNERGTHNYRNAESVVYTCHTGLIPGDGGLNIGQLVGSTDVWLWTPEIGIRPVIVKTDSVKAVNYKSNGSKPVEFSLDVELAQDRERR